MFKLLRIEWLKIKKYTAFWILLVLGVGLSFGWNYFLSNTIAESKKKIVAKNPMAVVLPNPYELPGTHQMVCYINSYFLLGSGLVIILLLTNEFNYRTSRQNIIDGLSRTQFAISKLLLMMIIAMLVTLVTFITIIVVGLHISPTSYTLWDNTYLLGYFFVQSIMYLMVALLISMWVKRSGLAIGLYFFVMLVDTILGFVLNKYAHPLGYFLPVDSTDFLIQNPASKLLKDANRPADSIILSAAIAYIMLFGFLFVNYFRKADLK